MLVTVIITTIIIGIVVLLLGVKIFFTKNGTFPNGHVDGNRAMQEKGITCAKSQDKLLQKQKKLYDLINEENY
ncbi:hypothetical protein [Viscerimonas tarda]